jgi:DNA-binding phage protein
MTRADDEKLLRALHLCARGNTTTTAARAVGIPRSTLSKAMSRIKTEDCLHDPTAEAYWQKNTLSRKDTL